MAWAKNDRLLLCGLIFIFGLCGTHARDGYLLTVPRMLRHGTSFEYCLTMYGDAATEKQAALSFVDLETGTRVSTDDHLYTVGQQTCREFPAPPPGQYQLLLINSTDIMHDAVKVKVLDNKMITLVQTDKPIYKPGQKVKFRILTLLSDLKARTGAIKSIYVKDPSNFRVKQYLDVDTQGIATLDFQLGSEAKLGKWTIEVNVDQSDEESQESSGHFTVDEYVLPRFEVEIEPPPFILSSDETISGKVCGKYTYGKPVTGFLHMDLCWESLYAPNTRPCHSVVTRMEGCYNFTVNASDVKRENYYSGRLEIRAKITEDGTGATVSKNHTGPEETNRALNIRLEDYTNGFFKPGLPYFGKVTVTQPNGQPAAGEVITVKADDHANSLSFRTNFTTNDAGQLVFALCGQFTANTTAIFIAAESVRVTEIPELVYGPRRRSPAMYSVMTSHTVRQWFSPSLSYVQLPRPEGPHTCGQRLTLNVPYTTTDDSQTSFQYQVMARGKIVRSGQVSHDEGASSDHGVLQPPPELCVQPVTVTDPDDKVRPPGGYYPMPEYHDGHFAEPIVRSEQLSDTVSSVLLDILIEPVMSPKFTLLVYHARPDGEVVADSMEFDVEPCFENQVTMEFNETRTLPGQKVDLKVRAAPGSVCGVGVVDKSVNILGGEHQITPAQIFEKIAEFNNAPYGMNSATYGDEFEYCQKRIDSLEDKPESEDEFWHYSSNYVDSMEAFKLSGMMVLTDLDLETRPCTQSVPVVYGVMFEAEMVSPVFGSGPSPVRIRSHFPETWLWDMELVGPTGQTVLTETTPDTITSWAGNALCMSENQGFGVSEVTSLTTFQPFFISIHLPYAAVKSERFPIMLTVYNYLEKCITVKLTLDLGANFDVHNSGQYEEPVCVCGGKSSTAKYYVTPKNIGSLPVVAKGTIVSGTCRNTVDIDLDYAGLSDEVHRKVLVKAPGVEQSYSYSTYMCSKDGSSPTEEIPLQLPQENDMVKDSARGEVQVIGDILGPALSNLDHLVRMPTGCGEQNMVGFVPNILVLDYLTSTRTLDEKIKMAAIENMEAGYQRELNYRHSDGSFSAFGEKDSGSSGSVWLTAFVVKSFAQARRHIFIDEKDMSKSVTFLRRSQLENGCYRETGKVLSSYMMGGLGQGKRNKGGEAPLAALTAYVIVALLEAGLNASAPTIEMALDCMNREFRLSPRKNDPYTVALISYANMQVKPRGPDARLAFRTLRGKAKKDDTSMYWSRGRNQPPATNSWFYRAAPSAEVEMTAYALMSYLKFYRKKGVQMSSKIAVWLTRQRNAFGGFASTQDTVVGLDALSQFAARAYSRKPTDLQVQVTSSGGVFGIDQEFHVSDGQSGNRFLLQSAPLQYSNSTTSPSTLTVSTSGVGCAFVQANVRYNKPLGASLNGERPRFSLKVQVKRDLDRCDRRSLHINVWSKKGHKFSKGMGLVTVRMITSWSPVEESITNLKSLFPQLGMKRIEYKKEEGVLALYFDQFTRRAKKFTLDVEQDTDLAVSETSPAEVRVFEYYETDVTNVQEYNIRTTCGTKQEIPLRPPAPVPDDVESPFNRVQQRRVSFQMAPPRRGCPKCITTPQTIPSDFASAVCNASAVYKGLAGRKGAKSMKLRQDLRPAEKLINLSLFASPDMAPGCTCSLLSTEGRPRRVMIVTRSKISRRTLYLDQDSIVMRTSTKAENAARAAQRKCPLQD